MRFARESLVIAFSGIMLAASAPALANPDYKAAKAAGEVGERVDGYIGIVGAATPKLQRIVDDINIKRKAVFTRKAQEAGATPEQFALTTGCQTIAKTKPGEKYQAPDGSWKTRTSAPPERLPQCPQSPQ